MNYIHTFVPLYVDLVDMFLLKYVMSILFCFTFLEADSLDNPVNILSLFSMEC